MATKAKTRSKGSKSKSAKRSTKSATRKRTKQRIVAPVGKQRREDIRELSKFFPSVAKLKGKRGLTASELGTLTKAKKAFKNQHNIVKLTETQAKRLKNKGISDTSLTSKGVRGIRLRNTSPDAKVKVYADGIIVTSNGRTWEYHPVGSDINDLAETGIAQLKRKDVHAVYLWTSRGRTSEGFTYAKAWTEYLYNTYTQYHAQQDFVYGVAVLIKEAKKKKRA